MVFRKTGRGLLALTLVLGICVLGAQPAQAAPASKCAADQVFIGVRGTDAPAGTGSEENGRVYASGGFGAQIAPWYRASTRTHSQRGRERSTTQPREVGPTSQVKSTAHRSSSPC